MQRWPNNSLTCLFSGNVWEVGTYLEIRTYLVIKHVFIFIQEVNNSYSHSPKV